jgi:hypothetical protein
MPTVAGMTGGGGHSAQVVEKRPDEVAQLMGEMPPALDRCRALDDNFPDCIGVCGRLALVSLLHIGCARRRWKLHPV